MVILSRVVAGTEGKSERAQTRFRPTEILEKSVVASLRKKYGVEKGFFRLCPRKNNLLHSRATGALAIFSQKNFFPKTISPEDLFSIIKNYTSRI